LDPEGRLDCRSILSTSRSADGCPRQGVIQSRAERTNVEVGESLPWHFNSGKRIPAQVSTGPVYGQFYADLRRRKRPDNVIEFGTASGVSGMYWTCTLDAAGHGQLHSFEVNPDWAAVASRNMAAVGTRFHLTVGAFEDYAHAVKEVDIAFIDAVHTKEWVISQFDLVASRCRTGAIVLWAILISRRRCGTAGESWLQIRELREVSHYRTVSGSLSCVEDDGHTPTAGVLPHVGTAP
jgi:predicted O-methyltransferase YrrM